MKIGDMVWWSTWNRETNSWDPHCGIIIEDPGSFEGPLSNDGSFFCHGFGAKILTDRGLILDKHELNGATVWSIDQVISEAG